jgi:acyl-CoA reductase-like NAD-dependent aldehyde dehydrogenase
MKIPSRLPVLKTSKLFIGGKFPRSESGRVMPASGADGSLIANVSQASRKDLRDAVSAARKAAEPWAGISAYLRSQILYRLAEMLESRAAVLQAELAATTGLSSRETVAECAIAIDTLTALAGWPDKLSQVLGSVNTVSGPYFNFTNPEPVGVTVLFAPSTPALTAPVMLLGAALATGNPCILVASERHPILAMTLAEAIATSDIPGGVVNILTGIHGELAPAAAAHRDIDAIIDATDGSDPSLCTELAAGAAENLKRVVAFRPTPAEWQSPAFLSQPWLLGKIMEAKTTWHPAAL